MRGRALAFALALAPALAFAPAASLAPSPAVFAVALAFVPALALTPALVFALLLLLLLLMLPPFALVPVIALTAAFALAVTMFLGYWERRNPPPIQNRFSRMLRGRDDFGRIRPDVCFFLGRCLIKRRDYTCTITCSASLAKIEHKTLREAHGDIQISK